MFKVKCSRLHFDADENVYIVVFDLLFCFISFFFLVQSKFRLGLFTFRFVMCLLPNVWLFIRLLCVRRSVWNSLRIRIHRKVAQTKGNGKASNVPDKEAKNYKTSKEKFACGHIFVECVLLAPVGRESYLVCLCVCAYFRILRPSNPIRFCGHEHSRNTHLNNILCSFSVFAFSIPFVG